MTITYTYCLWPQKIPGGQPESCKLAIVATEGDTGSGSTMEVVVEVDPAYRDQLVSRLQATLEALRDAKNPAVVRIRLDDLHLTPPSAAA